MLELESVREYSEEGIVIYETRNPRIVNKQRDICICISSLANALAINCSQIKDVVDYELSLKESIGLITTRGGKRAKGIHKIALPLLLRLLSMRLNHATVADVRMKIDKLLISIENERRQIV